MKTYSVSVLVLMSVLVGGCHGTGSKTAASRRIEFNDQRSAQMQAIKQDLLARGATEDRANAAAAKVPLMENSSSESIRSIVTGQRQKDAASREKFAEDLRDLQERHWR